MTRSLHKEHSSFGTIGNGGGARRSDSPMALLRLRAGRLIFHPNIAAILRMDVPGSNPVGELT